MTTLHDYQLAGADHIFRHPFCALWWEMGLGKSFTTLHGAYYLVDIGEVKRVLILGPVLVIEAAWPREIAKWFPDLEYVSFRGSMKQRLAALDSDAPVSLINYELLDWLVNELHRQRRPWPYDMIVLDEAHKVKGASTARFRLLRRIRKLPVVRRVVELTGTCAPQGIEDLWSQVHLLDLGERLYKTLGAFRARWFTPHPAGFGYTARPGAVAEVTERVADICMSLKAEDYLRMPDLINNVVEVPLPKRAEKQYKQFEKEMYLELQAGNVEAANAAVAVGRCLQLANGAIYLDGKNYEVVHNEKLFALGEAIEEAEGPVLVAYNFRHDAERILRHFPQARLLDKQASTVDAWNRGEIEMLVAHAAAGIGINLQEGGHTIVWFGLTWNLEHYLQFIARLHRQGQTRPVIVHHLVTKGTVDEDVMQALANKRTVQEVILERVKK